MKIAVYTIALNEAANAQRWADSAADADYRIVADTGSSDDTVERLTRAGVTVHRIAIRPWRFDDARNAAMALHPGRCGCLLHHGHGPMARPRLAARRWKRPGHRGRRRCIADDVSRSSVDDPTPLSIVAGEEFPPPLGLPLPPAGPRGTVFQRRNRSHGQQRRYRDLRSPGSCQADPQAIFAADGTGAQGRSRRRARSASGSGATICGPTSPRRAPN